MEKFKKLSLVVVLCLTMMCMCLVGCKNKQDEVKNDPPPVVEILPTISTLDEVNTVIKTGVNYQLNMSYLVNNVEHKVTTSVIKDKIIEKASFVERGVSITETIACVKEGEKYYEYINRVLGAPVAKIGNDLNCSAGATSPTINTKREITQEYYDKKLNEIVNIYIPLMDSANYEFKDGKYVLRADKVEDFAARMGTSVADAKKININIVDGKANLASNGVAICGKAGMAVEVKPVKSEDVNLTEEMKQAQVEGLTLKNAYIRATQGLVYEQKMNTGNDFNRCSFDGVNLLLEMNNESNGGDIAIVFVTVEDGKYFEYNKQNKQEVTKQEISYQKYQEQQDGVINMMRFLLHEAIWKAEGDHFVFNEANEVEILEIITSHTTLTGNDQAATQSIFDSFKGSQIKIEGEEVIIKTSAQLDSTIKFCNIGGAKTLVRPIDFANVVESDNAEFVPSPDEGGNPEVVPPTPDDGGNVQLKIESLKPTLLSSNFTMEGENFNILLGTPDPSAGNTVATYSKGDLMLKNNKIIAAVAKQDGQYYGYSKIENAPAERTPLSNDSAFLANMDVLCVIEGAMFNDATLYELQGEWYVIKPSRYDDANKLNTDAGFTAFDVSKIAIKIINNTTVDLKFKMFEDQTVSTVKITKIGSSAVVLSEEMLNAKIVEQDKPIMPAKPISINVITDKGGRFNVQINGENEKNAYNDLENQINARVLGLFSDDKFSLPLNFPLQEGMTIYAKVEELSQQQIEIAFLILNNKSNKWEQFYRSSMRRGEIIDEGMISQMKQYLNKENLVSEGLFLDEKCVTPLNNKAPQNASTIVYVKTAIDTRAKLQVTINCGEAGNQITEIKEGESFYPYDFKGDSIMQNMILEGVYTSADFASANLIGDTGLVITSNITIYAKFVADTRPILTIDCGVAGHNHYIRVNGDTVYYVEIEKMLSEQNKNETYELYYKQDFAPESLIKAGSDISVMGNKTIYAKIIPII